MGRCIEDARFQIVLCGVEHAHVEDLNLRLDSGGAHLLAAQFQELGFVHKYHTVKPVHRTRVKRRHLGSELPEGADTLLPGEPLSSGGGQVEQHRAASGADQAHRLFKFVKAHAPRVVVVPDMYMYHGGPCLVAAQRCLGNLLWLGRKIRVILLGGDRAGEGGGDNHLIAVIQTPGCGHAVSLFLIQVFNYHCRPHDAGAGGQAVPQPAAPELIQQCNHNAGTGGVHRVPQGDSPPLTFRPLEPAQRAGHLNQAAGQRLIGCFDLPGTPELEALSRFKAQFSLVHELYHQLGGLGGALNVGK